MLGRADLGKHQASSVTCTFYFTLQKGNENSRHTQEGVNRCSVIDTRRRMGAHVQETSNIFTHVHTGLCTEDTQYVTYVQRRPHKDSTTRSIPTRYTSTEDRTGKRLFWKDGGDGGAAARRASRSAPSAKPAGSRPKSSLVSELQHDKCYSQNVCFF